MTPHQQRIKIADAGFEAGPCLSRTTELYSALERENARLREALSKIEEHFIDGEDTYDGWWAMGNIAKDTLSEISDHQSQEVE